MSNTIHTSRNQPIVPIGLFNTPKDWEELQTWIEAHNREDIPHLWTAAAMAWNLAAEITNEETV